MTAGFEGVWRYGERWQTLRHGANLLRAEGWAFLELTGSYERYRDHQEPVKPFLGHLERMILELSEEYLAVFKARQGDEKPA